MKINLKNFKKAIVKGTMNFSIETLQLRFGEFIETDSNSANGTCISILKINNDVLDIRDEISFNFSDPSQNVVPYFDLFDEDEVDASVTDVFLKLLNGRQSAKIAYASDAAIKRLGTNDVKQDVEWFFEHDIDENFMAIFDKIKKIGSRFGKVYISVNDGRVLLETADKTNRYSNGLRFKLADIEKENIDLCFSYKDICNLFHCVEMDLEKGFKFKTTYNSEQNLGILYAYSNDASEKYALISQTDR